MKFDAMDFDLLGTRHRSYDVRASGSPEPIMSTTLRLVPNLPVLPVAFGIEKAERPVKTDCVMCTCIFIHEESTRRSKCVGRRMLSNIGNYQW